MVALYVSLSLGTPLLWTKEEKERKCLSSFVNRDGLKVLHLVGLEWCGGTENASETTKPEGCGMLVL